MNKYLFSSFIIFFLSIFLINSVNAAYPTYLYVMTHQDGLKVITMNDGNIIHNISGASPAQEIGGTIAIDQYGNYSVYGWNNIITTGTSNYYGFNFGANKSASLGTFDEWASSYNGFSNAISDSGQYMYKVSCNRGSLSNIRRSTNYGSTWGIYNNVSAGSTCNNALVGVCASHNGKQVYTIKQGTGSTGMISNDYGVSWTNVTATTVTVLCGSSIDGRYFATSDNLYDENLTMIRALSCPRGVVLGNDGSQILCGSSDFKLRFSSDYGNTFVNISLPVANLIGFTATSDLTTIIVNAGSSSVKSNQLFVTQDSGLSWNNIYNATGTNGDNQLNFRMSDLSQNISNYIYDTCIDTNTKCNIGYFDFTTFICLSTTECIGECDGNAPAQMILNGTARCILPTPLYFNICIGNMLCHNLTSLTGNINNDCPLTLDGGLTFNREYCAGGTCIDNQTFWAALNATPFNNDYGGHCGLCTNECSENTTRCFDSITVQTCRKSNFTGCTFWSNSNLCNMNYACVNGNCNYQGAATTPAVNGTSFKGINIFPSANSLSASDKILYVVLTLILITAFIMGLFMAISYSGGVNATPMGSFITGFIDLCAILYFIVIGFIPFWIVLLFIIIAAGVITVIFKKGTDTSSPGG